MLNLFFAFRARQAPKSTALRAVAKWGNSVVWRDLPQLMVRGFTEGGQTVRTRGFALCTVPATLLFGDVRFAYVTRKARVGCAAPGVVNTRLCEAYAAIHGVANLVRVPVFLPIVLPPANRTKRQAIREIQSTKSTAWASKAQRCRPHASMDELSW